MAGKIRAERDFSIGVVYLAMGVAGLAIARSYAFGAPRQMGPGFFPTVIAALLIAFGVAALVRGLLIEGPPVGRWNLKGMLLITGSVIAFGLLLPGLGLPLAIFASTLLAAAASEKFRFDPKALAGLAVLSAACSLVFVQLLRVPMPLVGSWLLPLVP